MITKKELEDRYQISLNTVRKTLEACGLNTSLEEYTEEDIQNRFEVARRMINEEQKSYKEVAAHFGVEGGGDADEHLPPPPNGTGNGHSGVIDDSPLEDAIRSNVETYIQEVTDDAVHEVIEHLPQMIYESARKAVQSGAIRDAFQRMLEQRRTFKANQSYGGATINVAAGGLPFVDDDDEDDEPEIEITRGD